MIYVYKDRIINVEWTVLKGTSTVKENFDRALVKLFLIGPHEKFLLKANAKDGIVSAEVPQGLPEGVYSVEIIYIKNWLGVDRPPKMPDRFPIDCRGNDRCIMRSRKDNLFAITEYESEATEIGEGEVVIRVKTSTASYGYDGLSAYEIAVLRGDFEGTEGEWLEWTHERIVTDVKDLLDKLKSRDTRFVVKTQSQRDNLKDLREGDEVYVIDDGIAYILETENGKRTWKPCDYGTVTSKYILSLIAGMPGFVADRAIADEFGKRIVDEYLTRDAVRNYMNEVFNDLFVNNPPTIMDGMITVDMLSDAVKQLIGFGPIVNFPDDEFLTTKGGRITPKDRNYDPNNYSGMGRKILRKNMVNGVNVLTQKMMSCPNTVYVITYDYSLRGQTITVPENCVLQFEGGSIKNGILNFVNTTLAGNINISCDLKGNLINRNLQVDWFNINPVDCSVQLQQLANLKPNKLIFGDNIYSFHDVEIIDNITIEGSNSTLFKPIKLNQTLYDFNFLKNMLKATNIDNITVRNITFQSVVTSTILPSFKSDSIYSVPLLWFTTAKNVLIEGCVFKDIEGCTYCNSDYTYYGKKQGLLVCLYDVDNAIIRNCEQTNCRHDEQIWVIQVHKDRESLTTTYENNYVHDEEPGINSSVFTTVCGNLIFRNNRITNYIYKGSVVNLFGTNVLVEGNFIDKSYATSVFDTGEYGYFFAENVIIKNNIVEVKNAQMLATIANVIDIEGNTFKGFTLLNSENHAAATCDPTSSTCYSSFYRKTEAKQSNTLVIIRNNFADFTNYDGSREVILPSEWGYGIFIKPLHFKGKSVIIEGNTFKSMEEISTPDINNLNSYHHNTMYIANMDNITIQNNLIEGTWFNLDSSVTNSPILIEINNGLHSSVDDSLYSTFQKIDSVVISNNKFKTQRNNNSIASFNRRLMPYIIIDKLIIEGNTKEGSNLYIPVFYTVSVVRGVLKSNLNSLNQYPYSYLEADYNVPSQSLGIILPNRPVLFNNSLVVFKDFSTVIKKKIGDIVSGERLENGDQIEFSDGSVWKTLGVISSFDKTKSPEYTTETIINFHNTYWVKLTTRKFPLYSSVVQGDESSRPANLTAADGGFMYLNGEDVLTFWDGLCWRNIDGTLFSKVVII